MRVVTSVLNSDRRLAVLSFLVIGGICGCYDPTLSGDGFFTCAINGRCPDGFFCNSEKICVDENEDDSASSPCKAGPEKKISPENSYSAGRISLIRSRPSDGESAKTLISMAQRANATNETATIAVATLGESSTLAQPVWSLSPWDEIKSEPSASTDTAIAVDRERVAVLYGRTGAQTLYLAKSPDIKREIPLESENSNLGRTSLLGDIDAVFSASGLLGVVTRVQIQPREPQGDQVNILPVFLRLDYDQVSTVGPALRPPLPSYTANEDFPSATIREIGFGNQITWEQDGEGVHIAFVARGSTITEPEPGTGNPAAAPAEDRFVQNAIWTITADRQSEATWRGVALPSLTVDQASPTMARQVNGDVILAFLQPFSDSAHTIVTRRESAEDEAEAVKPGGSDQLTNATHPAIASADGRSGLVYSDEKGSLFFTAREDPDKTWIKEVPLVFAGSGQIVQTEIVAHAEGDQATFDIAYRRTTDNSEGPVQVFHRRVQCTF